MNIDKNKLYDIIHDTLGFCSGGNCDLCDCEKYIRGGVCRSKKIVQNIEMFCTSDNEKKQEKSSDAVVTLTYEGLLKLNRILGKLEMLGGAARDVPYVATVLRDAIRGIDGLISKEDDV